MAQEPTINVQLFASGYCVAHEQIVNPVSGKGKCKFYAVWALIQIPDLGYVLFDTGYSDAFQEATRRFPARFYRWATPVFLKNEETAKSILMQKGIQPEEIKYIIISHFHADHVAGLKDFPKTPIICSKSAYLEVKKISGILAVRKGILHALLPDDFDERVMYIEDMADDITENKYGLTEYRLFGSSVFKLVLLPGHARGMLGFIVEDASKHLLYATDAAWFYTCYAEKILPKKVVKLFFDSWKAFTETQEKLRAYEKDKPDVKLLFTHCPLTLNYTNRVF